VYPTLIRSSLPKNEPTRTLLAKTEPPQVGFCFFGPNQPSLAPHPIAPSHHYFILYINFNIYIYYTYGFLLQCEWFTAVSVHHGVRAKTVGQTRTRTTCTCDGCGVTGGGYGVTYSWVQKVCERPVFTQNWVKLHQASCEHKLNVFLS
jgi:hypothetical protein